MMRFGRYAARGSSGTPVAKLPAMRMNHAGAKRSAASFIAIFTIMLACLTSPLPAAAEERVALVIGNSAYERLPQLKNPSNDSADIAKSFERLGFNVTLVQNASFEQFRHALLDFGRAASGADMAVLYYAGHGIEVAGENWVLPVDTAPAREADVSTDAIALRQVMLSVSNAKTLGLIILDACRNNVFPNMRRADATRGVDRGLAPIDPAENVLVAYAARDGTTARDGNGRNSPFTEALLRHLETPGLELEFMFRNVRDDVWSATNGEQQPFLYGSLSKDEVYLKEGSASTQTAEAKPVAPEETIDAGDLTWSFVRSTSDVDTLRRFTDQFPTSPRAADARVRIAALVSQSQQSDAVPAGSGVFTVTSTESVRLDDEEEKLARPFRRNSAVTEAAWKVLKDSKDIRIVRRFVDHFPTGQRRQALEHRPVFFKTQYTSATPSDAPPVLITREVLLKAATDEEVLSCFRRNDLMAGDCQRALQRYPLISQFTLDYRFRLTLCQALADACGNRGDFLRNAAGLQANALFNPANADPAAVSSAAGGVVIAPATSTAKGDDGRTFNSLSTPHQRYENSHQAIGNPIKSTVIQPQSLTGNYNAAGYKGSRYTRSGIGALKKATFTRHVFTGAFKVRTTTNLAKVTSVRVTSVKVNSVGVRTPNVRTIGTVRTPNVKLSGVNVGVPNIKVPTVKVPTVRAPTTRVPTVKVPTVRVPTVRVPTVQFH